MDPTIEHLLMLLIVPLLLVFYMCGRSRIEHLKIHQEMRRRQEHEDRALVTGRLKKMRAPQRQPARKEVSGNPQTPKIIRLPTTKERLSKRSDTG